MTLAWQQATSDIVTTSRRMVSKGGSTVSAGSNVRRGSRDGSCLAIEVDFSAREVTSPQRR
jgi:hypothetical protein